MYAQQKYNDPLEMSEMRRCGASETTETYRAYVERVEEASIKSLRDHRAGASGSARRQGSMTARHL